jgi:hypothetical protein
MNGVKPDLLTLVSWAEQLASGERCAPWEAWCGSSSEAAKKWARVIEAREWLASGSEELVEEQEVSAEELAAFVEGRLAVEDARRVEQACWKSIGQLAELLSAARFMNQSSVGEVPPQLESRLLALLPKSQNGHGKPLLFRLEGAAGEQQVAGSRDASAPEVNLSSKDGGDAQNRLLWTLVGVALVLVIALSGTIGYLAATWRNSAVTPKQIVASPEERETEPAPVDERPMIPPQREPEESLRPKAANDPPTSPQSSVPRQVEGAGSTAAPIPVRENEPPKTEPRREPASDGPKYRPRVAPQAPQLVIESAQGALLVDVGQRGVWRVAPASYSLVEPVKVLSLAESWTTVDAAGVGTFIWEGNAEAEVSALADGMIEVRLIHGRMGLRDLRAEARVRLLTGEAAWTVRGIEKDSTLAVVSDPVSPGLLVTRGELDADGVKVFGGQVTRWIESAPQLPQPINPALPPLANSQQPLTPPVMNPWDLEWLNPPGENARKQWRQVYGKLVERLTAAEDAGEELPKLLATTRDSRQAGLLARWSVATASGVDQPRKTWKLLADRRLALRVAAVKSVMELPPGDERWTAMKSQIIAKVGPAMADRIGQWHDSAWQPGAPPKPQADEIVLHLQHNDLAVRQFAVSYLELYTMAALQKMGMTPPVYDATATDSRRAAAQREWMRIIQELYAPARKIPQALTPRLQNALQKNALQGVP